MTREISEDFASLEIFIRDFNLSDVVSADEFIRNMKPMHKKLFSLMTFVAEIEQKNNESQIVTPDGLNYLKESVSDMGQALFCWIQGAYKPANLVLRSSIETFLRAIAGQENIEIFAEKSMYKVFELARLTSFFNSEYCLDFFDKIHSTYKDLCKIVHTADVANMAHISALKTFPLFSIAEAQSFSKDFMKISTMMLSVIYINYFQFIHAMHPKNQQNYFCSIPRATKKLINENLC